MQGIKHLIPCRCILPQFKRRKNPPKHQFVVFSIIEDDDSVRTKHVQCPNCGVIHKVVEIAKSEITTREAASWVVTKDDIRAGLPDKLVAVLESNHVDDVATWEEAKYAIENEEWGRNIVIGKETEGDETYLKVIRILSSTLFKVDTQERKEYLTNE